MGSKKSVDASVLTEAFKFNEQLFTECHEEFKKQRGKFICESDIYDLAAHSRFIQDVIETNGISSNCSLKLGDSDDSYRVFDLHSDHFKVPKLTIQFRNVEFIFNADASGNTSILLPSLDHSKILKPTEVTYPYKKSGLMVIFSSCTFKSGRQRRHILNCSLSGTSSLNFDDCKFEEVGLLVAFAQFSNGNLSLENCTINNEILLINGYGSFNSRSGGIQHEGLLVAPEEIAKIHKANHFEKALTQISSREKDKVFSEHVLTLEDPRMKLRDRININRSDIELADLCEILLYDSLKLKVSADQVQISEKHPPSIEISNSDIDFLVFSGKGEYRFTGKNRIAILRGGNLPAKVYWGGGQKFATTKDAIFLNRDFFLNLKANREIQRDAFQTLIVQGELAKCHHAILRLEDVRTSFQDRTLFFFSWLVSYYGTSWVRTLISFAALNMIVFLLFVAMIFLLNADIGTCDFCVDTWPKIYLELLNPIARASSHFCVHGFWPTLFDILHKIAFAFLAYELVKTLRRFGKANS